MEYTIQHNAEQKQFYININGKVARLTYKISADSKTLDYYSTYVPGELRGKQIGNILVEFALDYAQQHHLKVIPTCPFVKLIVDRQGQYQHLLAV